MLRLGVNIDHVATLRQARRATYPDPLEAALAAERAGADAITMHLREDRRHIQDEDLFRVRRAVRIHVNQEMAPTDEMLEIALELRPHEVCLVPERREELTTEGGLDAAGLRERLAPLIDRLQMSGIAVSLFIEPEPHQVEAAALLKAQFIELHTGRYANLVDADRSGRAMAANNRGGRDAARRAPRPVGSADLSEATREELGRIRAAVRLARAHRLRPNVGHGLNYGNVQPLIGIPGLVWAHIGHAIVARAVMVGMGRAVREMKQALTRATVKSR
ncbi:MAG TPA: pyridoxine 5'-phosphate synthase [Candidatus Binataceae bacterium]|nr:pyridoxine 5'-phosphate synthase [Candidatus Binataceae bacterium]